MEFIEYISILLIFLISCIMVLECKSFRFSTIETLFLSKNAKEDFTISFFKGCNSI